MSKAQDTSRDAPEQVVVPEPVTVTADDYLQWLERAVWRDKNALKTPSQAEYVCRRVGPREIEVAKFKGGDAPSMVYHVQYQLKAGRSEQDVVDTRVTGKPHVRRPGGSPSPSLMAWGVCDCRAGINMKPCKHLAMVDDFLKKEASPEVSQ